MLQRYSSTPVTVNITGRNIAHARRSVLEPAFVAADLVVGRLDLVAPTIKQAAALVGVCPAYAAAAKAIADDPDARAAVLAGCVPLVIAGWSSASETLADRYLRASAEEKSALGQVAGVGNVWDEVILPAL